MATAMLDGELEYRKGDFRHGVGELTGWRTHPNNVWSLHGYHECLTQLGRHDEARQRTLQRDIAVGAADVHVGASCFCRLTAFVEDAPGCCGTRGRSG
ncbi:hypothetical protein [Streptomyces sp. Inha503]|uniref:hypothetical protein n=1 Tax=Streptomyces sp. Inha503 TaxID=3383314 RepID=UPI0039A096E4